MEESQHRRGSSGPGDPANSDGGEALVDALIQESRGFLAASDVPDLTAPVMRRIARLEDGRGRPNGFWSRMRAALLEPRSVSFRFRPATLLAPAAVLLALAVLLAPNDEAGDAIFVQFRLYAPDAASVRLAGTFTGWQPAHAMHETSPGVWTVTVPLPPGVHDYSFVIDGRNWVTDPYAPGIDDGFGGVTSRMALLAPDDSRL